VYTLLQKGLLFLLASQNGGGVTNELIYTIQTAIY